MHNNSNACRTRRICEHHSSLDGGISFANAIEIYDARMIYFTGIILVIGAVASLQRLLFCPPPIDFNPPRTRVRAFEMIFTISKAMRSIFMRKKVDGPASLSDNKHFENETRTDCDWKYDTSASQYIQHHSPNDSPFFYCSARRSSNEFKMSIYCVQRSDRFPP